ncbi:polyketide synthase module [Aspergillus sclerotioniger CBS 115572]|uniref:Polyketide synthase module n=1 Tax=Aspergillus sclerotioniger CBS 115572 TaxID=1450535 RepID=A0A317XEQ1_9EURO|nr:polyketide synthase module [Aspergillus sclerotioniger CBS 115572]PWY96147.1 polyketide synthase module [Aspergillus sclerotioniger CBS 115572]
MAWTPQTSDSSTSLWPSGFVQEPIAVIGMACRLPGGSDSPHQLWDFLMSGGIPSTEVPESRFHHQGHFDGSAKPRTMRPPGVMFMENVDPAAFDAKFFNISPQDAVSMDPQQRILLEVVYEALENTGIPMETLSDYWDLFARDPDSRPPKVGLGTAATMLSNRVSHFLNIKGPSMPVNTACSSSLVAMDLACKALHMGEISGAIIAASNLLLNPEYGCEIGSIRNTHSPTGRCHTSDAKADGYVRAEGITAYGDPIRAIIRGIANNHNGRTSGIASPSAQGQAAVNRQAYANANTTDYSSTAYLECHGTGTPVDDLVEAEGVSSVFGGPCQRPLRLGSIKSNIGHSELAAGLSGFMEAVMIVETGMIPGNPTFVTPNPNIDFETLRLSFPVMPFRRVGVNCFGFGGSNPHVIVDEPGTLIQNYKPAYTQSRDTHQAVYKKSGDSRPYLLCLSADDEASLRHYLDSMTKHLDTYHANIKIRDLAYTLVCDRLDRQLSPVVYEKKSIRPPRIGFVFTGQGAQWPEMGRDLLEAFEPARVVVRNLDYVLQHLANPPAWSLYDELTSPRSPEHVQQPEYGQTIVTALQIVSVVLFRAWGIAPTSVVGYSSGEIAAAFAAGYLTEEEAIMIAYHRGQVFKDGCQFDDPLGMLVVGMGVDDVVPYMVGLNNVQIACYNSPKSITLSGTVSDLADIKERVSKAGIFARMLRVDMAYHSTFMKDIGESYESRLAKDLSRMSYHNEALEMSMFSSVSGSRQQKRPDIEYWKRNMVCPVRFDDAMRSMLESSVDYVVEIGPSAALKGPICQILECSSEAPSTMYMSSLSRGSGSINTTIAVVGHLWSAGLPIDLAQVNEDAESLPPLYWSESTASRDWRFRRFVHHDLLGSKVLGTPWRAPTFKKVEFPKSGFLAMAIEAIYQATMMDGSSMVAVDELCYRLRDVRFEKALVLDGIEREVHLSLFPRRCGGWYEFLALSVVGETTIEHVRGQIRIQDPSTEVAAESDRAPLKYTTPGHLWNKALVEIGMNNGPAFQRLQQVEARAGKRHTMVPALRAGVRTRLRQAFIPSMFDDLVINPNSHRDTGLAVASYACFPSAGGADNNYRSNASVYDPDTGELLMRVQGVSHQLIDLSVNPTASHWLTRDVWIPDIAALTPEGLASLARTQNDLISTILESMAHRKQGFNVLEINVGWENGASIWLEREELSHMHGQCCFMGRDAKGVAKLQTRYESETNASFRALDDHAMGFIDKETFDLIIVQGTSLEESSHVIEATKRFLSTDGHVLTAYKDQVSTEDLKMTTRSGFAKALPSCYNGDTWALLTQAVFVSPTPKPLHIVFFESNRLVPGLRTFLREAGWDPIEHSCPAHDVPASSTVLVIDELFAPVLTQVTHGAQHTVTKPDNALVSGLFRSIRSEDPSATLMTLDVEAPDGPHLPSAVVYALSQLQRPKSRWVTDSEYAERDGVVYIHRVMPYERLDEATRAIETETRCLLDNSRNQAEMMDNVRYPSDVSHNLPDGHVEVEVCAIALSQRHVGLMAGDATKDDNVPFEGADLIGSRVAFLADSTPKPHVNIPVGLFHTIPDVISFEEAASIPVAFCTAYYTLFEIGNLRKGQTVLIHNAISDVGGACVQICQYAQAEVFITTGTDEERASLQDQYDIPDDRIFSLQPNNFVSHIMAKTENRGIDLIVSSLTGDLLDASWRMCADGGTMVQIGKPSDQGSLSIAPFARGCSYRIVDLCHPIVLPLEILSKVMKRVFGLAQEGLLHTITPTVSFSMTQIEEAVAYLRSDHCSGKMALTRSAQCITNEPTHQHHPTIGDNAAYLIIGGLKGVCGSIATHLAWRGVRHIVVMSRSGINDARSQATITQCQSLGCKFYDSQGDVTRIIDVHRAFNKAPVPIGAIIHGAMLLRDRPYETMTVDEFHDAVGSKVHGAWNLHNAAMERHLHLDFFICLSSISSIVGSKGQANYAAANSFLDSFSEYRRQLGQRCMTVSLGVMEDIGVIAESESLSQRHSGSKETISIPESALHDIIDYALHHSHLGPDSMSHLITGLRVPQNPTHSDLRFDPRFAGLFHSHNSPNSEVDLPKPDPLTTALQKSKHLTTSPTTTQGLLETCLDILTLHLAQILRWNNQPVIEPGQPLSVYGLDSLAAVELRNWIKARMEASVRKRDIIEADSLIALGERVLSVVMGSCSGE